MANALQNELHCIINAMADGIYIADEKGIFIAINNIAAELEGISARYFIGKHASELIKNGLLDEDEVITLKVLKTRRVMHQYKESHNGRKIMVTGTPIFRNNKLFLILIQERDITSITDLQQELDSLTRTKERIENELAILTKRSCLSSNLIYKSAEMDKIVQTCMRIADVDTTVLITGESGTGKGVLANLIHECSPRKACNFIKIDCTAIPDSLFESELFGYEAGSFTGAKKEGKSGLIELANHGTLFIDEIGELPLQLQTKLLTAIQDKSFYRIGGHAPIPLDIRIITATNRNLEEMVTAHQFREDLYYRLNVVPITIPPLRERRDDIYPLTINFLAIFNKKYHLNKTLSPKALDYFIDYDWKGNVRQLENMIERLVVTTESDIIQPPDLPPAITMQPIHGDLPRFSAHQTYSNAFADFEKNLLIQVMHNCSSTKEMSTVLQIAPNTITTKLKKYGIKIPFKKGTKRHQSN